MKIYIFIYRVIWIFLLRWIPSLTFLYFYSSAAGLTADKIRDIFLFIYCIPRIFLLRQIPLQALIYF